MTESLLKHTNGKTMHSVPKKVAKRKINSVPEVGIKNKVKKVYIRVKKSATKADLFLYTEGLEQKYDALVKDNNKNIDKIPILEEKTF